jgi:leader peptidase (prepilin peptidase)/N-methyltransferase
MHLIDLVKDSVLFFALFCGLIGLIVGSFLNVVIHRIPIMLNREWRAECAALLEIESEAPASEGPYNLIVPRSRCPHCDHAITAMENIPVLSYLILGGKCAECKTRISPRYPLIEMLSAAVAIIVALKFGLGVQAAFAIVLSWSLIALAAIDFDTQLLPDSITLPLLWLGIGVNSFAVFVDLQTSVGGAIAGYLSLWSIYWAYKLLTGKDGMGYGDFKLTAMLGAWLGWTALPAIIIISSVVGAVIGVAMIVFASHDRAHPISFGPYLAIAGWIYLVWGERLAGVFMFGSPQL